MIEYDDQNRWASKSAPEPTARVDGGSAFPTPEVRDANGNGIVEGGYGMSLRDWFAGQALAMMRETDWSINGAAAEAYAIADAMLKWRSKP